MLLPALTIFLTSAALVPEQVRPEQQKATSAAAAFDKDKLVALVDELARAAVEKGGVPGLSIAIEQDSEILVQKGFGYADAARGIPASESTLYAIGSLTRQFTAVGILQLVEAHKLALDDELKKYLPLFPVGDHRVTIQHLLSNTSGIPGWGKLLAKYPEITTRDFKEGEFFKLFEGIPFDFEPGADFALDSSNYVLLSMILAQVSGEGYADYVRKHIIEPVGLQHTDFCPDGNRPVGFASDCKVVSDDAELEIPLPAAPAYATQTLCSTVGDIVRWQQALIQHEILGAETSSAMMKPTPLPRGQSTHYGYAIAVGRLGETPSYAHSGGIGGFRVRVGTYPLAHVTIAVVANCATAPVERIERDLARFILGLTAPGVSDLALSAEDAARCVGTYQLATTRIRIVRKGENLSFESPTGAPVTLLYQGGLVFVLQNEPEARITFHLSDGKCDAFTLLRGGFQSTAKRMD